MTGLIARPEGSGSIAVVIPCFRCGSTIGEVVAAVPPEVSDIILVDDRSDDGQAEAMAELARTDSRVSLVRNARNLGVGGATVAGYRRAMELGATAIVKVDSDGQMDPAFAPELARPVLEGRADYVKGNRFFDIESVRAMPFLRLAGNAGLTFFSRLSSGYWNISDPTNGFTAISADAVRILPLDKVHERYFFESDILFRLNTFGAIVIDQPMQATYGNEKSNLSITHSILTFPMLHLRNFSKRVIYNYLMRNFDVASLSLLAGLLLLTFGLVFGISEWIESSRTGMPATAGTVMLSVTPVLVGFQLLLSFLHYDIAKNPTQTMNSRERSLTVLQKRDLKDRRMELSAAQHVRACQDEVDQEAGGKHRDE